MAHAAKRLWCVKMNTQLSSAPLGKYKVSPFSGKNYAKNSRSTPPGTLPCAICGRPCVMDEAKHWAVVINGGSTWGDEHSPEDGGHMGCFPVGNDCHQKHFI